MRLLPLLPLVAATLLFPVVARSQDHGLKLAIGDVGVGIGDVRRLDGLRLNFRDRDLERARGVNVTIWTPFEGAKGEVQGLALGVPLGGAAKVRGVALGVGAGVDETMSGITIGVLGAGAGEDLQGIAVAGLGVGAGGRVRGIAIGGVGAGSGGSLDGLIIGGIGAGAGGEMHAIAIGGIGVGAGGSVTGLMVGGVGVGAGEDVTGIAIGGIGVGAGGTLTGIGIAGVGVGAPRVSGFIAALLAGGEDVRGLAFAPLHFRIDKAGELRGMSVSAFNLIDGTQRGLTIGVLNIASELHGLQLGVLNIAHNKQTLPILPLLNYSR